MKRSAILLLGLTSATLALPAGASDGRIEINQAKALAGGVTPGDSPGFPVQINSPGSYILTSDLDLSVAPSPENTHGIMIQTDRVTLDLNGFAIRGITVCTGQGTTLSCSPLGGPGSGVGIAISGYQIVVRNGTIRGTGGPGVYLSGEEAVIEDLLVSSCGGVGVLAGGDVRRIRAERNYGVGINTGAGTLADSTARYNRNEGIVVFQAVVSGNVAVGNGGHGIYAVRATVVDNFAHLNESFEFGLTSCGWRGNMASACGAPGCVDTPDSVQTGINNCDGAPCP